LLIGNSGQLSARLRKQGLRMNSAGISVADYSYAQGTHL
jgi:hypothetical protein